MTEKQFAGSIQNWGQKLIAGIALINLILVLFNLSYLPLRDIYFNHIPAIVSIYDPVKAIEPHPDTEAYLQTSDRLIQRIEQGESIADTEDLLADLTKQSIYLIEENPFLSSDRSAIFAKLKHRMEYRLQTRSTKAAFEQFWSREYLSQNTTQELAFFTDKIEPLLKTNYYRRLNANGMEVDNFWRIDLFFMLLFAIEYLIRSFWVSKQRDSLNWGQAMLRYWYDILMFVPVWRWLRIIPVTVKIHKSGF